nr:TonB-dependent receptor [Mesonia aestuariivivens]
MLTQVATGQNDNFSTVKGKVTSQEGELLPGVFVYVINKTYFSETNENGTFELRLPAGKYKLSATNLGYLNQVEEVEVLPNSNLRVNFQLEEDPAMTLDDVEIVGKSALQEVQESSYNVSALNAEALHNTTLDVSQALERVSGVRVRRSGGVGSNTNLMLNGFSGRHVKLFIDGMPMEGFNSAFSINNIPINLAKRIEVYKGVVPINFGSDALGGAINIVTEDGKQNFVDASYSYGSFNTHKSFLNAAYTADSGFTARLTAFQNYSDNDYNVDVRVKNLQTQVFPLEKTNERRFHDMYRNYTLMGKVGFVNTAFADQLLLGFTYGDEYNEIQHPAYMDIAFGQVYETSETLMPSLTYKKDNLFINGLNVAVRGNYNFGEASYIDDAMRNYNWAGDFIEKSEKGEYPPYTRNFYRNRNGSVNANVTYKFKDKHAFTLNNVFNTFSRKRRNEAEPSPSDDYPSENFKNILGAGYKFQPNKKWSTSLFGKYYSNKVNQYADPLAVGEYQKFSKTTDTYGYGLATSYFLTESLQMKASFEKAYRLPVGRELFGNGSNFELGNPDLKPESSKNLNIGANYNWRLTKKQNLNLDASFIYRDIKDFIRRKVTEEGSAQSINEASVKNRGIDLEATYNYAKLFSANASFTYQSLRNKLEYKNGSTSKNLSYDQRIPNMPYLYGNAGFAFYFNRLWDKKDVLSLNYNLLYIHEFSYDYDSFGNSATNRNIPNQIAHDVYLNYSFKNGKYNLSLECKNILNEDLYDNYSLQKPGRSFAIKVRYFLDKF